MIVTRFVFRMRAVDQATGEDLEAREKLEEREAGE
jgi:hypothetical protein